MAETLTPANPYFHCTYRGQEQVPRNQVNPSLQGEETNCTRRVHEQFRRSR